MKVLVTGAAGFIGFHCCLRLLREGHEVVGLDNINDYYQIELKKDRLKQLGIMIEDAGIDETYESALFKNKFRFYRMDLDNRKELPDIFAKERIDVVCHLAAQAGVRYSLENPEAYIDSNIVGFLNILECCRHHSINHLVYASSSSVYGMNAKIPFSTTDRTDNPISLYAATKKSNELMAHTYSHLYGFPTTGLRFFTVYGPWGRPDMAVYLFTDAIANNRPIKVFNNGDMERDFTYIDDIVEGIIRIVLHPKKDAQAKVYNIGNSKTERLGDFISTIEKHLKKEAKKEMLPMQAGDVQRTWANVDGLKEDYGYEPNTSINKGVKAFVEWYTRYYGKL